MASTSGSKNPESGGQTVAPPAACRECESCRTAPGIPFCRVEWSFLCTACAAVVHGHNCVVSVPPNPNPNPNPNINFPHLPYFPHPFANPSSDPNAVVHLSSEDDDHSPAHPDGQGRCWSQIPGRATAYRRLESVMRYREKRKSRRFEKTVRYENRRAFAELRPRLDGKFARRKDGEGNAAGDQPDAEEGDDLGDQVSVRPDPVADRGEMEVGRHDFLEDTRRFQ